MDRFFRGLVAGIIGGLVMNIWNLTSYYLLNFANISVIDWSGIILLGYKPVTNAQYILSYIAQVFWSGFLGILLAYLLTYTTTRGYLIKGAFLGFITSFLLYAIPVMFDIADINAVTLGTAVTDLIGGMLWGVITVFMLRRLDSSPNLDT